MALGHHIKRRLKIAARSLAAAGERQGHAGPCSRILTYHSIGDRDHEMNVTPDAFRAQMEWLAEHAEGRSLAEAVEGAQGVAITFDDGYRDNLTIAAPILADVGLSASVFIVAGRVGMRLVHDRDLETGALMTWEEILEIESMGWAVGGHSLTHRRLAQLSPAQQRTEIRESTRLLEDNLGHGIEAFAYPYGSELDFNRCTKALVREHGYSFALSNRYGVNVPDCDRWALRRIWIDRTDTQASFQAKVSGALDALAWFDSPAAIRARRAVNGLLRTG